MEINDNRKKNFVLHHLFRPGKQYERWYRLQHMDHNSKLVDDLLNIHIFLHQLDEEFVRMQLDLQYQHWIDWSIQKKIQREYLIQINLHSLFHVDRSIVVRYLYHIVGYVFDAVVQVIQSLYWLLCKHQHIYVNIIF